MRLLIFKGIHEYFVIRFCSFLNCTSFGGAYNVPPDNNGSQRAIRNIKVKQKISGQFKSMTGAMNFAILRSITDTAIKNIQNVLKALSTIATLNVDALITD